ncbi:hypothetical protein ASE00_07550 [Sphingomonas sp. Root710]|uniref:hypothetical protein n=1 Tax=Sphingomonas sp. Root710 TaxID=1736594 RepID=UPI0006F34EED|nr:hypothetical protein [Sphingomonas sp. Root710]KRB86541.1 hypothetical protein ASE00_07550 [Sphingomonas sp. Root710]
MTNSDQMIDDRRLQLDSNNMFRRCRQNGMPKMPEGIKGHIVLKTAYEIQRERMAAKTAA